MRVLNLPRIDEACLRHPDAETALRKWLTIVAAAEWHRLLDIRNTYAATDTVKLESDQTVTIFDIKGNTYRLITTVDYRRQIVAVWYFLTNAEYDKEKWKTAL